MDDDSATRPSREVEHTLISASVDLEQLDENLFRSHSRSLWVPYSARGVFGGLVISQALLAATKSVPEDQGLHAHSLHCYFLLMASPSIPILYYVERTRQGRSFATRSVKAVQQGRTIFTLMVSFSKVEINNLVAQWPMPKVKSPEDSMKQEDLLQHLADIESDPKRKEYLLQHAQDRKNSPIEIRMATDITVTDHPVYYWYRARAVPKFEAPYQKCILAYMADLNFMNVALRAVRKNPDNPPPVTINMVASLDHAMWFYDHDFDTGEWLLYSMDSPRAGLGRGTVMGCFYNQAGKLVAVAAQEGVVRGRDPRKDAKPKL